MTLCPPIFNGTGGAVLHISLLRPLGSARPFSSFFSREERERRQRRRLTDLDGDLSRAPRSISARSTHRIDVQSRPIKRIYTRTFILLLLQSILLPFYHLGRFFHPLAERVAGLFPIYNSHAAIKVLLLYKSY